MGQDDPIPNRWGFVGSGKMATALVRGMIRAGAVLDPSQISVYDPSVEAIDYLSAGLGITAATSNTQLADLAEVIVLAVKPQVMTKVLQDLQPVVSSRHLVISVAAGVTLAKLGEGLGPDCRLVRTMPNTPALVGEGAAAYCLGANTSEADEATVLALLGSVGLAVRVGEALLDAVTGLSGSGPAFAYTVIDALSDGGVRMGLPREVATKLAAQTILGAARMVLETGLHPGVLKDQVTSPGGTTIAGLHALERGGLRAALMDAVQSATLRASELGHSPDPT